jgi:Flp pilus assembly protein TadD
MAAVLVLSVAVFAQEPKVQEPPEEDESLVEKEYSFNPLQAAKEMKIGDYYAKRGNHKAAAARYQEATRWEPGNARAWLRLGESLEKLKDDKRAREAYAKYLEIEPDSKQAPVIKKKLTNKS